MEAWQQTVIGIASAVGAALLLGVGSWLIATYREFCKMSALLEKIAAAIEDHESRLARLELNRP